ncbi:lysozyme [Sphingomonas sp. XXL09]|uniref:lysozyme n=1 Tax=Sphingomonas sp. XXL09 TaxID=3457787 RepID=UPI00406BB6B3
MKQLAVRGLAGILGSLAGASLVMTAIPAEESGRKVAVTIAPDGKASVRHISGPQYLRAYLDAVKVPTACDGITSNIRMGQTYTEAQCATMLEAELSDTAKHVVACVPGLYGRPNQAAASVILAYNIGWPTFCRSTAARRFKAGAWRQGCDAFLFYDRAGGRVLPGLAARRKRERQICLTGLA